MSGLSGSHVMGSPPGAETVIDGKPYLYFAGTGYLGLQGDPRVIEAACEATRRYGVHTATSRGGFGDNPVTLEVERLAARFFGTEDAFYFATGFAGPSIITAEGKPWDLVLIDEYSHYATIEAADRIAMRQQAIVMRFRHGDAGHLEELITAHEADRPKVLVMCDGVSPVLGDIAPVHQYVSVTKEHIGPSLVVVDDAHGVGVLGESGRGTLEYESNRTGWAIDANENGAGLADFRVGLCATLSKALGGYGGIIAGSTATITRLKAASPWFNGASAPPAAAAGATARALQIVLAEPQLRQKLHANVAYLKAGLRKLGIDVAPSPVPIIPVEIGDSANMQRIAAELKARGIIIAYIPRYSGVGPAGCLRMAVFATHTPAMLDRLIEGLAALI